MTTVQHDGPWNGVDSSASRDWRVRPGLDVERVATGFSYPVNLVFANPGNAAADAPWLYVSELHGSIQYVTREGKVVRLVDGLINFSPVAQSKSDESGVSGLCSVPGSRDLIVTTSYEHQDSGLLSNRILRLQLSRDGRSVEKQTVLLDLQEFTAPSNQIQQALVGPDGKLYVSVGDAENAALSRNLRHFGGKLLRLNLDGSAARDNPFFDPRAPHSPRSYVYALGVRNVMDFDFQPHSGRLYAGDNGKDIDRLFRIERGSDNGWNGFRESVRLNALYNWEPSVGPVGFTFLRRDTLGPDSKDKLYVAQYGPPAALGQNHGKRIVEIEIDAKSGNIRSLPVPIVQYVGEARSTVLGLAEGPDGLYFTDFFGPILDDDAALQGAVYRVFPSNRTLGEKSGPTTALGPAERGARLFYTHCSGCHVLQGRGGQEGPALDGLAQRLTTRLNSDQYVAELRTLLADERSFARAQRGRINTLLNRQGHQRLEQWLEFHLLEPRFDNLRAKMPSFAERLTPDERNDLSQFLLGE